MAAVFLTGHGVNDRNGVYYFLPVNVDPDRLRSTGLPYSDLKAIAATLPGKVLLFFDTCHTGNVWGTRRDATDLTVIINELTSADNGVVVFAATTGNHYSLADPAWGSGACTQALVEGLGGKAASAGQGRITINILDLYFFERVKELTRGQQAPATVKPYSVPDFPVAVAQ